MHIDKIFRDFPSFKLASSIVILFSFLVTPLFSLMTIFVIFFSKVHTLGAFLSMWRAKRLTWIYAIYASSLIVGISYLGAKVLTLHQLSILAFTLISFHYVYDEYELDNQSKNIESLLTMALPLSLFLLTISRDLLRININLGTFIFVGGFFLLLEMIFTKSLSKMFLSSKVLSIFLLLCAFLHKNVFFVMYSTLILHYFYWLAFPIYKLHKYKKEDRDDFVMILILIILISAFVYSLSIWGIESSYNSSGQIALYISSIIHIFSVTPFCDFMGLKKKSYV